MSARLSPGVFLGRSLRTSTVGDLTMADVRYTSGAARHHHERAYFCLIRCGAYSETFGRRTRECRPGLVVFHPPGESHAQTLRTPTADALNVELGPRWLSRMHEHGVPLDQPFESDDPELGRMAGLLLLHVRRGSEPGLGCSLGEYARRRRLERARRLVAAGHVPLAQIAADAGSADQSRFTRTFKRFTGVTPRYYRTFLAFKTGRGRGH